jgi:hypothetical protein
MDGRQVNTVARYPRIITVSAFTLLMDFNRGLFPLSGPFRRASPTPAFGADIPRALASPEVRDRRAAGMRPGSGHRRGDGSGATQPEEFFEKPSRDDKPEPPIGHPPRVHRFDPRWTGAAALRSGLAQAPSRAYDLPHNRPRKRRRRRRPSRRFRFTGPGSPAMIRAQIIPQRIQKRRPRCRKQGDHG